MLVHEPVQQQQASGFKYDVLDQLNYQLVSNLSKRQTSKGKVLRLIYVHVCALHVFSSNEDLRAAWCDYLLGTELY